jgi:subtilase family serine protease
MKHENLLKFMMTATLSLVLFGCKPDLKIETLTHLPKMPTTEDTITFTATVKNIGFQTAGRSTLALKVGGETVPTTYPVPALSRGERHQVQRQETLSVAQRYRNTATADFKNDVRESNENNNQKIDEYRVVEPDD